MLKLEEDEYFLVTGYTSVFFLSLYNLRLKGIAPDRFIFCGRTSPKGMVGSTYINVDFSKSSSIKKLMKELKEIKIKYMFLNHGLLLGKSTLDYSFENFEDTLYVNVLSYFSILSLVAPSLVSGGSTVLMSSVSAKNGSYDDVYSASKSAIESFIKSYVRKIGPHRVNCIAPGIILNTNMTDVRTDIENLEKKRQDTPLKRLGQPEDVAESVYFLLSEKSRHISAAVIRVDGGI